jgi:thioredoxin reductase
MTVKKSESNCRYLAPRWCDETEFPMTTPSHPTLGRRESTQTGVSSLFAAGDIRAKPFRQMMTAVADGTISALAAQKFLRETSN